MRRTDCRGRQQAWAGGTRVGHAAPAACAPRSALPPICHNRSPPARPAHARTPGNTSAACARPAFSHVGRPHRCRRPAACRGYVMLLLTDKGCTAPPAAFQGLLLRAPAGLPSASTVVMRVYAPLLCSKITDSIVLALADPAPAAAPARPPCFPSPRRTFRADMRRTVPMALRRTVPMALLHLHPHTASHPCAAQSSSARPWAERPSPFSIHLSFGAHPSPACYVGTLSVVLCVAAQSSSAGVGRAAGGDRDASRICARHARTVCRRRSGRASATRHAHFRDAPSTLPYPTRHGFPSRKELTGPLATW